ncbi:MAG TPA: phosphate ABC transporter permease PstA [Candidatus Baltobacteraceae bacterium]|nr:phosphate ABC transporter permease PstA [Candidatus Baltobacteraceae bacterium]
MAAVMRGVSPKTYASRAWWALSVACLIAVIGILFAIFAFVLARGVPALKPEIFFTPTHGIAGGLSNAIAGTFLLVIIGLIMVIVVGLGTAVWTVEFAPPWGKRTIRFMVDVLAGIPSIVVGYFLYVALVEIAGWGFSLIAGSLALAIFMLPYVVRAADVSLTNVPTALKEGAAALGARPAMVVASINFPYALPGILTGLLVATGIGLGETAPLIYTAGWSNYMPSLAPTHSPVGYLTYVVWTYISQPFEASHQLAYAAAALLMIFVFLTNLLARSFVEYKLAGSRSR